MLSYRHGFHAGNRADVLKHTILIFCLEYLAQKPKPFLYVDTHAGAGSYALDSGFAAQNKEWASGILRIPAAGFPAMVSQYLKIISSFREGAGQTAYPGSPLIAAALLRTGDSGCCFELHPADFTGLQKQLAPDRRFQARKEDGFAGLKSLLPPLSRRALIFIDPSYELSEDYPRLISALQESLRRFSTGLYVIWYPLLLTQPLTQPLPRPAENFSDALMSLYDGPRCRVELLFNPLAGRKMYGCGLVLFNPPWTLQAGLGETLPFLADCLGKGSWNLTWGDSRCN
jgi:23S rRNA (adenine2030-N6)-methyltransferase